LSIKRYNGSAQTVQEAKRWNGSEWVKQTVKRWNGTAWVNVSETLKTWQKWSIKTEVTILSYKTQIHATSDFSIDDTDQTVVATAYSFDTETGEFSTSGTANLWSNGGGYSISGGYLESMDVEVSEADPREGTVYVTTYEAVADQTSSEQVKDAQIGTVTSYDQDAYPDNGIQDGFWYIAV